MFLTTHTIASLATLKISSNPIILFGLNFLLHYILDSIPHGDWGAIKGFKNLIANYAILFICDIFFVITIYFLYTKSNPVNTINVLCAITGSILPDILWGMYYVTKLKFLKIFVNINYYAHQVFGVQEEQKLYFLTQILVIFISLMIIY
ncbi:MAG TPA: hypothetical protein PLD95_02420 [bacterium]|jgi:hypothetical protein|nr:hypothetical protein [bacterium]HOG38305.1 hypothetical protein [bacterium]HQI03268.1 hypothetical protein [bacterium]